MEQKFMFEEDERFINSDVFYEPLVYDVSLYSDDKTLVKSRFFIELKDLKTREIDYDDFAKSNLDSISFVVPCEYKGDIEKMNEAIKRNEPVFAVKNEPIDKKESQPLYEKASQYLGQEVGIDVEMREFEVVSDDIGSYNYPYDRCDGTEVAPLYDKMKLSIRSFFGTTFVNLRSDHIPFVLPHLYLVSPRVHGMRCWYIVYCQKGYIHLKDGRFFFVGRVNVKDDIILDCDIMDDFSYVVHDVVYYNRDLTNVPFFGRWQHLMNMEYSCFNRPCKRQQYCPLGAVDILPIEEGLIFTPVLGLYKTGNNKDLFVWKGKQIVVDLMYRDGALFSAMYRNRKFFKYKEERKQKLDRPNGTIVEMSVGSGQWVYMRDRNDKSTPNADTTVHNILGEIRISYGVLMSHLLPFKRMFFIDGGITLGHTIEKTITLIEVDNVFFCVWGVQDPVSQFVLSFLVGPRKMQQIVNRRYKKRGGSVACEMTMLVKKPSNDVNKS